MRKFFFGVTVSLAILSACNPEKEKSEETAEQTIDTVLIQPGEKHFKTLKQLTFGGDNAEGYFSFNSQQLVFQSNYSEWGVECDQIFYFDLENKEIGSKASMLSSGAGRTTCSYFFPDGKHILYGSTHLASEDCPETPPFVKGKYVWGIYPGYDIFKSDMDGNIVSQLTSEEGYDAEATISPQGDRIVFTSTRSGDLELWTMDMEGGDLKQITDELGYDGGAFFSPDGKKLVFRASRPETEEDRENYKNLLRENLVQPTTLEIFICNADGSDIRQVTHLGGANWAPFFTPDGKKIIFSSNHHSESKRQFNLFMVDLNGENIERISFDMTFDAFPMFSFDGKYLVFSSNRNNQGTRDTNIFLAEWID
jgi:TolB protein